MPRTVAVVGAGLLGRYLTVELEQLGCDVTLFDADGPQGHASCGRTAAGMLSPFSEIEIADSTTIKMGQHSLLAWPTMLAKLGQPVHWSQQGSLLVSHQQDYPELRRFENLLRQFNLDHTHYQSLSHTQLAELEPSLNKFDRAYFFPTEAHIDTHQVYRAFERYLLEKNIPWHQHTKITQLDELDQFDWVVDVRGRGAMDQWDDLRGVRGEVIHLYAPEVHLTRAVRLMHPRHAIYIVPFENHKYVIGASSIESEDMSPISVQSTLELLSAAYSCHSGFAEARITHTAVNCRPAFPNNKPRIRVSPGLIEMNGLYRHGYSLAPALCADACAIITDNQHAIQYPEVRVDEYHYQ